MLHQHGRKPGARTLGDLDVPPLSPLLARSHAAYALIHELNCRGPLTESKASQGPFPWPNPHPDVSAIRSASTPSLERKEQPPRSHPCPALGHVESMVLEDSEIVGLVAEIDERPDIQRRLPKRVTTVGSVLRHCTCSINTLLNAHAPMSFKIGFTHNPIWRWQNSLYGYKRDKSAKWQTMEVLYVAAEPYGPAMLEAALIDKYQSL